MIRRLVVAVGLIVLGLMSFSPRASAHALLASSEPAAGAALASSPREVVLHFTEPPDAGLSAVHVVDSSGRARETGGASVDATDRDTLRVPVPSLPNGTYTVTWRTTSSIDGHTTAGSFAFGVGEPPAAGSTPAVTAKASAPAPSALGVVGRALLYAGLAVLVGGAVIALVAPFDGIEAWAVRLAIAACVAAAIGAMALGLDELHSSGAPVRRYLASSPGRHWEQLVTAVVAAAIAVAVLARRARRGPLLVASALAALAMLSRVDGGHAAAESPRWFAISTQWLHFVAVGAWIGALPWFVMLLRRTPEEHRRSLGRQYATVATAGLAVVALTGTLRALDEVSAWGQLIHDSFGRTLLVKLGLVAIVVVIGTANHFVLTRRLPSSSAPLARAVRIEIGVGAAIVVVTGLLTGLAPASSIAAATSNAPEVKSVVVEGNDYATTIRVRLEVSPGVLGPNRFRATITDYDRGVPDDASAVKLRFALASRPDLGRSNLDLSSAGQGAWEGSSAAVAMPGVWDVTAVVSDANGGVEVPLRVRLGVPGLTTSTTVTPGQPTIYDMRESDGTRLQTYVDPGRSGKNTVHLTMFDASGNELAVDTVDAAAFGPDGGAQPLAPARDGPGHFTAPATLTPGSWTYAISFAVSDRSYVAMFDDPVEGS